MQEFLFCKKIPIVCRARHYSVYTYTDFSKTFVKIDQGVHKLIFFDLDSAALKFFFFLKIIFSRTKSVCFDGYSVLSGVTQGSSLGPLLFLLLIIIW